MAPTIRAFSSLEDPTTSNTLGAALIGVVGSGILFGITCLQGYLYYHRYPTDGLLHKVSVAVLWLLDCLHLALTIHAVYHYLVLNYGQPEALSHIVWSLQVQVSLNIVIILIVQSLYAHRVWFLGGFRRGYFKLAYLVALTVLGGFVVGILLAYAIYSVDTFQDLEKISWAINASLATSTTVDFTIATAMCYYLDKSMNKTTAFMKSGLNSRMSALMQYTLGSGLLTSACSLSTLFTFNLMPNNFIFLALEFLLTRLYVGSFFAMLNARQSKRAQETTGTTTSVALPTVTFQVHTVVTSDSDLSSPSICGSPRTPYSEGTGSDGQSTYVSCEEPRKVWDTLSDAESAVLPSDQYVCRVFGEPGEQAEDKTARH
ncbi:hypothetical protein V5O48_004366 [Marasmius crinis-equi]|uniref:DUF6534 domain-containing protein n=1 Tax=Marasmius crinis-equi TaxID=585013 RepID=A0ABR3FQ91_9AGAR